MTYPDFYEGDCFIYTLYSQSDIDKFHHDIINSETIPIDFMEECDQKLLIGECKRFGREDIINRCTIKY